MGRSESIPVINGKLELGEFGHIYFIDFDQTRPRERTVTLQIIGE
ncbi:MAG: YjbQ family protein [Clostridiales bacterium]|nr:YjbQ family protein [Clostridiales bacterium]